MRRRKHLNLLQKTCVGWAALALAITPAAPALAATGSTVTGSIAITERITHPAYAYQVFDGDVEADGSIADIDWGSGVNGADLLAELRQTADFAECDSARGVAEKLRVSTYTENTRLAKLFAEIVSHHLKDQGAVAFDDLETPLAEGLDDGWYVVASDYGSDLSAGASLLFPGLITVGAGRSDVTPKESTPTLTKEVQEDSTGGWQHFADFEMGQTIKHRLTATIGDSDLGYYSSYYLGFSDTLSTGLDLNLSSVKVWIDGEEKTGLFDVDCADRVLSVVAEDILSEIVPGSQVVVTYDTSLNTQAVTGGSGNDNSVVLTYSADPRTTASGEPELRNVTPNDTTEAYTYELRLTKTDERDNTAALSGAKFSLKRPDGKYALLKNADGTVDTNATTPEGFRRVFVSGWADSAEEGGYVTTGPDGCANIVGLDSDDSYILNEALAPDGYDLDTRDIPFAIDADASGNTALSTLSVTVTGGETADGDVGEGLVGVGVTNVKAPILPVTGLGGIAASVVLGSGLVAAAATVIVRQTSRGRRE